LWIRIRIGSDLHYFYKLDLDPDQQLIKKLDPDPHLSKNPRALEAQNRAVEGHGRSQEAWRLKMEPWTVHRPVVADSLHLRSCIRIQIHIKVKSWIKIRITVKSSIRIQIGIITSPIHNTASFMFGLECTVF
jgi:hypothetical protein